MANESTNNAKKEKFIGLLHELFQLNQPELDFGLYRIMHAKSGQIKAFIKNDLASEIDEAFADSGDDKIGELKAHFEQARAQAVEFGITDPDSNPKVKEAKEAYDAARDNGDDPSDIYDHLYRFFSRYYDKGDFLSRRYHVGENESRAAPYAVPYDGREVYLHWANKDQYYIKSSEYLSNFSFDLSEATEKERKRQSAVGQEGLNFGSPHTDTHMKVTLQLVDAAEGGHNNVKENLARFFIIHADNPIDLRPIASDEGDGQELIINFEYRPDPEKSGQESGWQKKRLQEAESVILDVLKADESLKPFHDALAFLAPTEKDKTRTLLAKYLVSYTARNTMDYFIHKDLGGFLRRELDFYIKNEIIRLDDLSSDDINGVTHSLKKITALRAIARQIIDFLAQLENFQKKLWLKKKFVTEVNYCITLDRVPKSFYTEVVANQKQWQEWHKLGFVEDVSPSIELIDHQPFMMLDTGLFDESFKERLLAEIVDLDEQCDGVLVHSDNFQALNLIKERYNEQVKCIYIDPPYNTGEDGFNYKDSYKSSSWLSMVNDRVKLGKSLNTADGLILGSIDDKEVSNLDWVLSENYGFDPDVYPFIWHLPRGINAGHIAKAHEYILPYFINRAKTPKFNKPAHLNETSVERCNKQIDARHPESEIDFPAGIEFEGDSAVFVDEIPGSERVRIVSGKMIFENGKLKEPVTLSAGWTVKNMILSWLNGESVSDTKGQPIKRFFFRKNGKLYYEKDVNTYSAKSVITGIADTQDATAELMDIFGGGSFTYPKASAVLEYLFELSTSKDDLILDYFAGSGTTGQAVINLNRIAEVRRKYILIEMGDYFDAVLKPRITKVVHSDEWKNGKPVNENSGISHCFKYIRLESYEDSLNNLNVSTDDISEDLLTQRGNIALRKDYYINYFLDVETRGSASLLNVQKFSDPNAYTLMVKKPGSDTQVPTNLDLVETFNWLLGLEVALLDKPRTYDAEFEREHDPELPEDQHTRLRVKRLKEDEHGSYWFRVVEGYVRRSAGSDVNKEKVMVIWRKLTENPEQDAAALEALLSKYRVNQSDSEYDKIYINGPHGLSLSGQAKAKLMSLEETFMARMWEDTDGAMH